MKNRKMTILIASALTFVGMLLSACGSDSKAPTTPTSAKMDLTEYALSLATPLSAEDEAIFKSLEEPSKNPDKVVWRHGNVTNNMTDSPAVRADRAFFIELKKILGDKVELQFFFGGSLGTSSDQILGGLQAKNFESQSYNVGAMAEYTNAFMPLDVMFLVPDLKTALEVVNGEPGDIMRQECIDDTGLNVLYTPAIGMRHITTKNKAITKVSDLKGLKIRVQNNPLHLLAFSKLGSAPTPIAYAELFTSLQQGVVDGQENPIANIYAQNYVEVQKNMTLTNHLYTAGAFIVNNEWLLEQTPEFQEAVKKATAVAAAYSGPELTKTENGMLDYIKSQGMMVTELVPAEYDEFVRISKETWTEASAKIGADYFNKVVTSIEKITKK
ncbi:TRAP transporter substrate-binding protein [Youngiibacter multivorans]|uniref:Tripartite ATP-independent transporter DctP family solute receptor n=1 Tax=Youngiibacter multivorans TaxID=937251 RepID=A0ABS4FZF4_9CLOT|nr:TRAP transporter substrate-binding protein [Youngiibacter multivorans]MBP1917688.1 tripartite ATP-independent transporter DctP family solute receptor [Youngiibacter multivorans]